LFSVTRRQWIHLAAGSAVAGSGSVLYARSVEPKWFDLTHTPVSLPGLRAPIKALHLADLHSSRSVPTYLLAEAIRTGLREKPDIVFLTGDYISTMRFFDEPGLERLFRQLAKSAPVYAVMGNHDCAGSVHDPNASTSHLQQLLRRSGVRVLMNASDIVEVRGARLSLVGTGDLWTRHEFDPDAAFAQADPDLPVIVLAHNPDTKDRIVDERWDLMLSGHTHGGQVVLPFVHPYWLPVKDQRFIAGLYGWRDRQLFITRGVGSPGKVRLNCRPEVSILHLHPGSGIQAPVRFEI
jgi:predicted MPP superfamily phosphohydrolase